MIRVYTTGFIGLEIHTTVPLLILVLKSKRNSILINCPLVEDITF